MGIRGMGCPPVWSATIVWSLHLSLRPSRDSIGTEGPSLVVGPESLRSGRPKSGNPNPKDTKLKSGKSRVASIGSAVSFQDGVAEAAVVKSMVSTSSRWFAQCGLALLLAFGSTIPLG